jgi:radical SAM superfamily enzyme YgiQ (UPF0313 family)
MNYKRSAGVSEPRGHCDVLRFVRESGLYEVQVTFLTAFPGTPLYARLQREGRILRERAWELCTLFDINFQPKNMSVAELQSGFLKLARQPYAADETRERRAKFKRRLRTSLTLDSRKWQQCHCQSIERGPWGVPLTARRRGKNALDRPTRRHQ